MTKTISSRIDNRTHNDLVERCNRLGCNINEFVAEAIKLMLTNETDFEFEIEESSKESEPQVIIQEIKKPVSEVKNIRVVEN